MISTPFYKGQGLGNQLANYVTMRCLALDRGFDFGVQFPENFKGKGFMNLDMGIPVIGGRTDVEGNTPEKLPDGFTTYYREEMGTDGDYDPKIVEIGDNTLIHGNLQGEEYFKHRKEEINEWLKVEPMYFMDNTCVINFRGGEYKYVPDFFLPKVYWDKCIEIMKERGVKHFIVATDDIEEAKKFFPDYECIHNIGENWRMVRYAPNLILSNSSFGWLPAWLNDEAYILAPKYWQRHNKGYWFLKQNFTEKFNYI